MRYKPKTRVCAYTHVYEKDLPPGQKLLNCAKCHETCYVDRASQIAHWKQGHKAVCCAISEDSPGVAAETDEDAEREGTMIEDFDRSMQTAGWLFKNPEMIRGRLLLAALQEIRFYMVDRDIVGISREDLDEEVDDLVISKIRDLHEHPNNNSIIQKIWAIPGFCNYFLSDDIFLSAEMQHRKENCISPYAGRPSNWKEKWKPNGTVEPATRYDQSWQLRNSYAQLVEHIFFSAIKWIDDRYDVQCIKPNALCAAAIRRVLTLYESPYNRVSFPSLFDRNNPDVRFFPRTQFFFELFMEAYQSRAMDQYCKEDEIVPGLSVARLFFIMMEDESFIMTLMPPQFYYFLEVLSGNGARPEKAKAAWKHVTIQNRVDLMDSFRDFHPPPANRLPRGVDYKNLLDGGPIDLFILNMLICDSTNTLLKVYESLKLTVKKRERINPWSLKTVEFVRNFLLETHQHRVHTYLEMIEPVYQQRQLALNETAQSFPEELIQLIAEFTFQDDCEFGDEEDM